jgi:hypothetical protein
MLTSPLFGLVRTRSRKFDAATDRYSELLGKRERTNAEEAELAALRAMLQEQTLLGSTPAQLQVEQAVRQTLQQTLTAESELQLPAQGALPEELELELKRQLAGLLGSREVAA